MPCAPTGSTEAITRGPCCLQTSIAEGDAHSQDRQFDPILVRKLSGEPKWLNGTTVERTGPVSYHVQVGDLTWHRYVNHILDRGTNGWSELPKTPSEGTLTPEHGTHPFTPETQTYPVSAGLTTHGAGDDTGDHELALNATRNQSARARHPALLGQPSK